MPSIYHDPDITDAVDAERDERQQRERSPEFAAKREAAKTMLADAAAAILGVMFTTRTAPAIAQFTGMGVGTVYAELAKLEAAGEVTKTGEQLPDRFGAMHQVWRKVNKPP